MPALRKRRDDIPLLTQYFTDRFSKECNRTISGISLEARDCQMHYSWPGNVRELENSLECAWVFANDDMIEAQHLPQTVREDRQETQADGSLDTWIRRGIISALRISRGNVSRAAKQLGIAKTTLYRRLKDFNLDPTEFEAKN